MREEPLAPKCPPTLNEVRCPGIADPVIHGQASAVLEPTPHVSGLSGDIVEIFGHPVLPSTPRGQQLLVWSASLQPKARALHVPALSSVHPIDVYMCNQSVQPFVLFDCKTPRSLIHLVDLVVAK